MLEVLNFFLSLMFSCLACLSKVIFFCQMILCQRSTEDWLDLMKEKVSFKIRFNQEIYSRKDRRSARYATVSTTCVWHGTGIFNWLSNVKFFRDFPLSSDLVSLWSRSLPLTIIIKEFKVVLEKSLERYLWKTVTCRTKLFEKRFNCITGLNLFKKFVLGAPSAIFYSY